MKILVCLEHAICGATLDLSSRRSSEIENIRCILSDWGDREDRNRITACGLDSNSKAPLGICIRVRLWHAKRFGGTQGRSCCRYNEKKYEVFGTLSIHRRLLIICVMLIG